MKASRLLFLLLAGCAYSLRPEYPAPGSARTYYDAVDWRAAGDESVEVLRQYLRVDTTNPPGNETRGANFMGDLLKKEGIPYEIFEYAPGRGNIIARLDGANEEPPLCLVSHMDVVTAEPSNWPKDTGPLSGALDDKGMIWGRGALDMKGLGAAELMTMILLKRAKVPLRRSVILLGVAAEETDSGGIQFMVDHHWDKLGCSQSLNEGGIGIKDLLIPGQTVYTISTGEKGVLWLEMTAHGEEGHGSVPLPIRSTNRLITAIEKLKNRYAEPIVHPTMYDLAARAGDDAGGITGFVLKRRVFFDWLVKPKLLANPPAAATMFNTINVTGFEGKKEPNVVPSSVSATLDCRVLPGTRPVDFYAEIVKTVDDPNVTFRAIDEMPAGESPTDDPFFDALARNAVDGREHVVAGPILSPGYTDSLFMRRKGCRSYGLVPFEVTIDDMRGYHGKNERVSAENVKRGVRTLYRAVVDVAAKK